jgi:LPXTG-site transpeptidase (sortase) family protein
MRPRVTPAAVALTVSLGVLVAVPVAWSMSRPASPSLVGELPPSLIAGPSDRSGTTVLDSGRQPAASSPPAAGQALPPRPVGIRIPQLSAEAPLVPVGVGPDGQVALPDSGFVLGWYRFGPRPGQQQGSAVVVGHRDTQAEGPGVLFDLPDVVPGDRIDVDLADGSTVRYRVVARESITKQRLPLERLFARSGGHRLTLITCGGPYLPDLGGYQENVIVTAVPLRRR